VRKIFGGRLRRLTVLGILAMSAMLTMGVGPATAQDSSQIRIDNIDGVELGWGQWYANPSGSHGNGWMQVHDSFCDGNNGIIAQLSKWEAGEWIQVNLVSIRGCDKTNSNDVTAISDGGPAYGQRVRFRVCKLLPNGDWKDCENADRTTYNW
jgi:hypothetical protein